MQLHPPNKYRLKDLHHEIDFMDRRIAYCHTYEKFESEHARAGAVRKLLTKRGTLVKEAVDLASKGVEFDPKHLPRSFKNVQPAPSVCRFFLTLHQPPGQWRRAATAR